MLDKLKALPADQLTVDDQADLAELEDLAESERAASKEKKTDPADNKDTINNKLEEILKCLKPQQEETKKQVEIPTPAPVVQNGSTEIPKQESSLKKILKALW